MKITFIFAAAVLFSVSLRAQTATTLDGKTYIVELFLNKNFDSKDTLYFNDGEMTYASATKFGFQSAAYKAKQKDSTITFNVTNKSKLNGTMFWVGEITGEVVKGTETYDNPSENPVKYVFEGKEMRH